ncbi:MAG: PQQ-binding-like beta-propeller repeat protein [Solirubrobacteraceae bacterium]
MRARRLTCLGLASAACALLAACGSTTPAEIPTPTVSIAAIPSATRSSTAELLDWPEFGLDPQRSDVSELASGITAVNVAHLRHVTVALAGTVDSSPIYLHGVSVDGAVHDVIVVTTTYGRTIAIDASGGQILWTFTPPGYSSWAGSARITTASPLADPDRLFVYAASPNGLVHKLSLADGREDTSGSWPVSITREPVHEKLAAALNVDGPDIIAATGGYFGDAPPYQGHVVVIARSSGRLRSVFNTLCANRRELQQPSTCSASDSAILSRGGAVVEPGGGRILIDTGNGPWNGTTDFGDSVLELTFPGLSLLQSFTPADQEELNTSDTDLGSSAPALLGEGRVVLAGKDGIMRLLALSRLDGHPPSGARARLHPLGGELQRLSIPGGGELFTAPAVWRRGRRTTMFVADEHGTAAYVLRRGLLYQAWENNTPGTSPVMAGGLLYVYEPDAGGIAVYRPSSPRPIAKLAGEPGHWNSPIVVDGHVVEPEGNANAHKLTGTLEIFSAP